MEFERVRHAVGDHLVTITSWYDTHTQTWGASAPAYAHVFSLPIVGHASRRAAMEQVINVLSSHFRGEQERSPS
jgi:hypothetical protein